VSLVIADPDIAGILVFVPSSLGICGGYSPAIRLQFPNLDPEQYNKLEMNTIQIDAALIFSKRQISTKV
jgi:hypothetical protein